MSKWKKPNWYPSSDIKATKKGWVYTKNFDEVLNSIPNLDVKLKELGEDVGGDDNTGTTPTPKKIKVRFSDTSLYTTSVDTTFTLPIEIVGDQLTDDEKKHVLDSLIFTTQNTGFEVSQSNDLNGNIVYQGSSTVGGYNKITMESEIYTVETKTLEFNFTVDWVFNPNEVQTSDFKTSGVETYARYQGSSEIVDFTKVEYSDLTSEHAVDVSLSDFKITTDSGKITIVALKDIQDEVVFTATYNNVEKTFKVTPVQSV